MTQSRTCRRNRRHRARRQASDRPQQKRNKACRSIKTHDCCNAGRNALHRKTPIQARHTDAPKLCNCMWRSDEHTAGRRCKHVRICWSRHWRVIAFTKFFRRHGNRHHGEATCRTRRARSGQRAWFGSVSHQVRKYLLFFKLDADTLHTSTHFSPKTKQGSFLVAVAEKHWATLL
jgi:hypothetical protein